MTQTGWNFDLHKAAANEKMRRTEKRRKAEQARRAKHVENTID